MKITVAIPAFASDTYDGSTFLKELIDSIMLQTYQNYEVIVSDHSESNEIFETVREYINKIDIKYFRNTMSRGNISCNTNNAIKKAIGDIIKVLHVDDKLCNNNLFEEIVEQFKLNPDKKWGACAFNHNYVDEGAVRREMVPVVGGVIGNPSVSFFVNDGLDTVLYDEDLFMILDSDFHDRLHKKYGQPIIIDKISVTVRMHKHQSSKRLDSMQSQDIQRKAERDGNNKPIKIENNDLQKHIIIGGAGFVGSHISDALIEKNERVLVIDNLSTGKITNLNPKCSFVKMDVSDINSVELLEKYINKNDIIYHLAAFTNVQESILNPIVYNKNNVDGVLNVLNASKNSDAKTVIFSSSSAVYGNPSEFPTTEKCPIDPISPYALNKLIGEQYCNLFSKIYNLSTVCLRYFNVYGERMRSEGAYCNVIGIFSNQLKDNKKLTITNDGNQRRDFVYVKDVANANIIIGQSETCLKGEVFNIGSGVNYSINQISEWMGGEKEYIGIVTEPRNTLCDNSKFLNTYNYNINNNLESWIKLKKWL